MASVNGIHPKSRCPPPRSQLGLQAAVALISALAPAAVAAGAPVPGDVYVYRLVNGYNGEVVGEIRHEVERVADSRIALAVTPDGPAAGAGRTEVLTPDGNGLRQLIDSHGEKVEYEFAAAYPAYVLPLDAGKSWSVRVAARITATGERRTVRVDGKVVGRGRIRVPAGEFDAVKILRYTYPGDATTDLSETHVEELDWYAPALGRAVRTERRSGYQDYRQCTRFGGCGVRGDWDVLELVQVRSARPNN